MFLRDHISDGNGDMILLDPAIRDWVLIPITLVMFMQGILRQYVAILLKDDKKATKKALDDIKSAQQLRRSHRLRTTASYLPLSSFKMRKTHFVNKVFCEQPKTENVEENNPMAQMQDPGMMMGMMKQNMAMIVPNMLLMGWVSYFFAGFVLVKLPFGLTDRFKAMLQRGIAINNLDVSYVSSLSWYFITLFGLRGLFDIVLGSGNDASDNPQMMAQQMGGAPAGMQPNDTAKMYASERTELEITSHDWIVAGAEYRLLGRAIPSPAALR